MNKEKSSAVSMNREEVDKSLLSRRPSEVVGMTPRRGSSAQQIKPFPVFMRQESNKVNTERMKGYWRGVRSINDKISVALATESSRYVESRTLCAPPPRPLLLFPVLFLSCI